MEVTCDDDLEVAAVLAKGLTNNLDSGVGERSTSYNRLQNSYSPRRSSTVLTNNSRGNTATVTPCQTNLKDDIHQLSARGELVLLRETLQENQVNSVDDNGLTALQWACMYGQADIAAFLVKAGALVDSADSRGITPLMLSAFHGHVEVVRVLLAAYALINNKDKDGNTALLHAVVGNQSACVRILLEHGADLTVKNCQAATPMDLAVKFSHKQVQRTIEMYMIKVLES